MRLQLVRIGSLTRGSKDRKTLGSVAGGHVGMKIEKPEDVEPALRKAFTEHKDDLVFMDFIIDPVANVFPIVAAGKGLTEMILAEDL